MALRTAWLAAQKPSFRLEIYELGAGENSIEPLQTVVYQDSEKQKKGLPRPPDAWILYRTAKLKEFKSLYPSGNIELGSLPSASSDLTHGLSVPLVRSRHFCPQAQLSRLIASMWKAETAEVKFEYYSRAEEKRRVHSITYPHYKYRPKRKAAHRVNRKRNAAVATGKPAPCSSDGQSTPSEHRSGPSTTKKLIKAKSSSFVSTKLVSPRADVHFRHRHRSTSPYPTSLVSTPTETLRCTYNSGSPSIVDGFSPSYLLEDSDLKPRDVLACSSYSDAILSTHMRADPIPDHVPEKQWQGDYLHETSTRYERFRQRTGSEAAPKSGKEAQYSPGLVNTAPAPPRALAAIGTNLFPTALTEPQESAMHGMIGELYQASAILYPTQQYCTQSTPQKGSGPHKHTSLNAGVWPHFQHVHNTIITDDLQAAQSAQPRLEQSPMNSDINNRNGGASYLGVPSVSSSSPPCRAPTDLQWLSMPTQVDGTATSHFDGNPRHVSRLPSVPVHSLHASPFSCSNLPMGPLFSPSYAVNALQWYFADLQVPHPKSYLAPP